MRLKKNYSGGKNNYEIQTVLQIFSKISICATKFHCGPEKIHFQTSDPSSKFILDSVFVQVENKYISELTCA